MSGSIIHAAMTGLRSLFGKGNQPGSDEAYEKAMARHHQVILLTEIAFRRGEREKAVDIIIKYLLEMGSPSNINDVRDALVYTSFEGERSFMSVVNDELRKVLPAEADS